MTTIFDDVDMPTLYVDRVDVPQFIVGPGGPVVRLALTVPVAVAPGAGFGVTVSALNVNNNVYPLYRGHLTFTSSDGLAVLPPNSFIGGGVGTYTATLTTLGFQTITATDVLRPTLFGSAAIAVSTTFLNIITP